MVQEGSGEVPGAGTLHPDRKFDIFDEIPSMTFSIFDARMASTLPGTYLK